jgi:hypothetical protein
MRFRDLAIRNIASPYGMTASALLLFLVAVTFPPQLYSSYIQEPDLMFFDPASLVFFLLCTLGFVLGLLCIDFLVPVHGFTYEQRETRMSPAWFILLPLIVGITLTVISIVLLLRNNATIVELLFALQGQQLKTVGGIEAENTLVQATPALMGIVWWAIWRKDQLEISGWRRFVVHLTIVVATLSMVVWSVLMMTRGELVPILAGIVILTVLRRLMQGKLTTGSILRFAPICAVSIVAVFASFSVLRGTADLRAGVGEILGYTIASYNRLAAILDGRLRYPFAGKGLYFSGFISFNRTFNGIFHANQLFSWPDFNTVWQSEFGAVDAAGLNGQLILGGTFGYIFSEMGWLSPLLLFVDGLIVGWAWRSLKLGKISGIVLYPWCAYFVLSWFGMNSLFEPTAVVLLLVVIVLGLYESLFVRSLVKGRARMRRDSLLAGS